MTSKNDDALSDRVQVTDVSTLSDHHYILRRAAFQYRRADGVWQDNVRESYDIGDGAAVLPIDRAKGKVILVRQFRWPAFEHGYRRLLTEVIAGKLDGDTPQACVIKESLEEAGLTITNPQLVFHCFMSPGAVTERLSLFLAEYDSDQARQSGGGFADEGEDIEVLEIPLHEALDLVRRGEILDAKTIILLQHAVLERLGAGRDGPYKDI
jgi:nudix-type nucleoside diphosphatase (YffH/AdpP family)